MMLKKFFLLCLMTVLLTTACSNKSSSEELPHILIIKQAGVDNIVTLDQNYRVLKKKKIGEFLIDAQIDSQTLYVIDPGIVNPKKDLYAVNLLNFSYKKLSLPYIPQRIFIHNRVAYISSSVEAKNKGFYFMIVDLDSLSLIQTLNIPGAVRSFIPDKEGISLYVNTGGPDNYGGKAKIVRISRDQDRIYQVTRIVETPEELPPNDVDSFQGKFFGACAGFAKGPKPKWVKNPQSYTSKLKVLDIETGSVLQELTLDEAFPQNVVIKGDLGFVNHYTDLDMTGDTISVYDLKNMRLEKIEISYSFLYGTR